MKITVFTSNQRRHQSLIRTLAIAADEVYAVQECTTLFPGRVDDFYRKSEPMRRYFTKVMDAEAKVFGAPDFLPSSGVHTLSLRMGDLSSVGIEILSPALKSDFYVVFGSSWIRGPLIDALIDRSAINLHMGMSPWYRGTGCNFWACYDKRYEMVGGTIHMLSRGLDSGAIIAHAVPSNEQIDTFDLGMLAVRSTHEKLASMLLDNSLADRMARAQPQDKSLEIRYSRNRDFTDDVASEYLAFPPSIADVVKRRATQYPAQ